MLRLRAVLTRLLGCFSSRRRDHELAEEIQQHVDALAQRHLAVGMTTEEAKKAALREFGAVQQIKEQAREERSWIWPNEFWLDLKFGFRMLRRNPAFSSLALICLTLGIGTNAAVFSWIEGVLLHPYPLVAHEDRMFALTGTVQGSTENQPLSYPDLLDLAKNCTLAESVIVDRIIGTSLSIGDRAERASAGLVSANYFDALGIHPILGRGFRPEEGEGRNAHPVAVISYETWRDRYQADPGIIGRTQMLNGVRHTIIGVAPEKFYGTFVGYSFQFWVPVAMQETFDSTGYKLEDRGDHWVEGYLFLKPGVTRQQAQDEITSIARRLEKDYPTTNRGRGIQIVPLWKTPFNAAAGMLPTLEIAVAVVVLVLLIACANVSNLLLVRALMRRHEMTVRMALGAGRRRLIRQLLTEGLILSLLAAGGGILVAHWCRNTLVLAFPAGVPGIIVNFPGQLDWKVLTVSGLVCLATTLFFGLAPAIQASHFDLTGALKSESTGVVGGHGRARLRSGLVLIQIALSFVLLTGGGLLLQSLHRTASASPGFYVKNVILSGVDLFSAGYTSDRARRFQEQLLEHLRTVPGFESVASARVRPFSFRNYSSAPLATETYQPKPDEQTSADYNEVSEDYFKTIGTPILSGREFTRFDNETAPLVVVVNEILARKFWPDRDPLGQRLKVKDQWMQVVGVAKTANYRTKIENPRPFFYVPLRQNFSVQTGLIIHTQMPPGAVNSLVAKQVQGLDPTLAPQDTIPIQDQLDRMSYTQRLAAALLTVFGGMALLLAAIGLYAVMSYAVSQGTREFGLRMALGADTGDLLRLVLLRGMALTGLGLALGLFLALGLTGLIATLLYQTSPRDPLTFAIAFIILIAVAFVSCVLPALRAARVDPARALRT